jgi:AhpD family alkylhydroperoxidase
MSCNNNNKKFGEMCSNMGGFAPDTLKAIKELNPDFIDLLHQMDEVMVTDGALDKKTKRLMALSCVAVRMCEDCIYAQAKVAKNYGATKEEIIESIQVAVLIGGVPCWSVAKKGIAKLFSEWED